MVRKSNTRGHCGDEVHDMEATFLLASSVSTTGTKATFELPTTMALANGSNNTTLALLVSSSSSSSNSSVTEREAPSSSLADVLANVTAAMDSKKRKSATGGPPQDRLQRSRERNKIHARKTRQRKKEQMQTLQSRADELKADQLRLKQIINEKNTASILVGLFACSTNTTTIAASKEHAFATSSMADEDPRVEELLKRPAEEIPDSSKISELPSLILPGHYSMRRGKAVSTLLPEETVLDDEMTAGTLLQQQQPTDDGIDYDLLSKDRSKCSAEELDRIRRERNKLHAKRTRDRKRRFMEEMGEMCRQLQDENNLLRDHLRTIDPDFVDDTVTASEREAAEAAQIASSAQPTLLSPKVPMIMSSIIPPRQTTTSAETVSSNPSMTPLRKNITALPLPPRKFESINHCDDQIQALLAAAVSFEQSQLSSTMSCTRPMVVSAGLIPSTATTTTATAVWDSDSCASLIDSDDGRPVPFPKRPRLEHKRSSPSTQPRC